jgi:putative RNA 2'-phosphotransferase
MNTEKLSKTMAYALRHKPEEFGLTLNSEGWVSFTVFVEAMNSAMKFPVTEELITEIVVSDNKQRYTVKNGMIRAAQGHSFPIELGIPQSTPPEFLFHGTTTSTLPLIFAEGLKSMSRAHVHLSSNIETAKTVGARHGKPVVLQVKALAAHQQGIKFFQAENGVWLATPIPATFIMVSEY